MLIVVFACFVVVSCLMFVECGLMRVVAVRCLLFGACLCEERCALFVLCC